MRNTKQRELILQIVNNSFLHMSAEEIYNECAKSISNISLGTVYRNLNYLVESKKIKRLKMPNNIDRYDKNKIHSHVICNKCGKIDDIFVDFRIKLPNLNEYVINDYDLCFNGICKKCLEKES